jgi:EAL domain-containing protein (putative c-di-GMP-specific phosphodiesterase class I)/CheY-like chemotaxis protein
MSNQTQEPMITGVVTEPRPVVQIPVCFVIDQDSSIRHFISLIMQGSGVDTQEYADGPSFRSALGKQTPDVVFIDVPNNSDDAQKSLMALGKNEFRGAVQLISTLPPQMIDPVKVVGTQQKLRMLPCIRKPFESAAVHKIIKDLKLGMPPPVAARIMLDDALANNWIEFWYQPKIDINRKKLIGVECLARARHPLHGVLPPHAFMPGARDVSLSGLAKKAVEDAVRISAILAELGVNVPISINMPLDILNGLKLGELLEKHKPDPMSWPGLIVDLHEKSVIHDIPIATELSRALEPHNVKLALDDFGNGYNAVAKTTVLPFAEVKIGREFVTNCSIDKAKAAICKNAIELARKFGASTIAVGIERGAEVMTLAGMGCNGGQGFLLGQPMPETRFVSLLRLRANLPKAG